MLDVRMIERGLEKTGKSKGGLATAMGVRPGAVSEILSGLRLIKASEIAPIIEYLWRGGRGQAEERGALPENHRTGKILHPGQPHQLQRQADQGGEAGMDRGDLRHPAEGPDRAIAGQSRRPDAQGSKNPCRPRAGEIRPTSNQGAAGFSPDSAGFSPKRARFLIVRIKGLTYF